MPRHALHCGAPRIDPIESAAEAGLRYVSDGGQAFGANAPGADSATSRPMAAPVRDAATLLRIKHLVIPPAWTDVWICPLLEWAHPGHRRATRADASSTATTRAGAQVRDAAKYER